MADDLDPAAVVADGRDVAAAFRRAYPNLGPEPHAERERQARVALAAARDGEAVDRGDLTDAALVDLYWRTTGDDWAIPDDVIIRYGGAVLAARGAAAPTVTAEQRGAAVERLIESGKVPIPDDADPRDYVEDAVADVLDALRIEVREP